MSRRNVVVAGTALIVAVAGGTAWGLGQSSGAHYRTGVAGHGNVVQTLTATGTVAPVSHADEAFQVQGTVARVTVKTGQKVHAGQVLAHLDRAALRAELNAARSTLAAARSRMASDESGQSQSSSSVSRRSSPTLQSATATVVAASPPSGGSGSGAPSGGASGGSLTHLQAAVRAAQQATDQALAVASAALQDVESACSTSDSSPGGPPSPNPTATSSPVSGGSGNPCAAAGSALLSDQQAVDAAEQQVATAEAALAKAIDAMIAAANNGSNPSKPSEPSSGSTPSGASPSGGSAVSAADIALDQASIDQAQATVAADRADLAQATLRATISGRVAAVNVSHGDEVSAQSTATAVTIVGSRQEQTTISLPPAEIRRVKIGMTSYVVVDGSARKLTGRVVNINAAGTTSSTGAVSYPVTLSLPAGTKVVNGAAASVTIVVASVDDVLTVPTSSVHYSGTTAYVETLRAGKPVRRPVKVGAVGAALTQISSGITDGQQVVLADLDAAVPSSSSTFNRGGFRGSGGAGRAFLRRLSGTGGGSVPAPPAGAPTG